MSMEAAVSARLNVREVPDRKPAARESRQTAARAAPAELRLDIHDSLDTVEREWCDFERHADCTVFQSFGWLTTWQRHIGAPSGVQPAIVTGCNADGATIFILPLAIQAIGPLRMLTWLGARLNDYNAPLLAPDFTRHVAADSFMTIWRDVIRRLQARFGFDVVILDKMPPDVGAQSNPMLALPVRPNASGAYATPLAASWDEFYAARRSASTRRRDRTKRKRLAEFGDIRLVTADGAEAIRSTLDLLAAQKARAFARMGVTNIFTRAGYKAFYRDLASGERTRNLVHISRLDVGTLPAAINLGLTFRDRYYHLLASYDDGETSRFSPGAAHLHDVMRYAIERGYRVFDFTIGDEPYKRDWSDGVIPLYDLIAAATWRGKVALLPLLALRWLKRQIKQTPVLWQAFSKARVLTSRLRDGERIHNRDAT